MLEALGRRIFANWFADTDTYSTKIDILPTENSRQKEKKLRTEIHYQPSSEKNLISRTFAEKSLLIPQVELSEKRVITLDWVYKDGKYLCKYTSKFELSSERGVNLLLGPHDTLEDSAGIKTQVNPFEAALKGGRLRKRNSWKHVLSNPAETITKRKPFRSRQSSLRTEFPLLPNPPPVPSNILDKEYRENQTGLASLAAGSNERKFQNTPTTQNSAPCEIGTSTSAFLEAAPYPEISQLYPAALLVLENRDLEGTIGARSGTDTDTHRDSRDLTEEMLQSSAYSSVSLIPIERFLDSTIEPYEDTNTVGVEHSVLARVQERGEDDIEDHDQHIVQKPQEQSLLSESPPSKHPQIAFQGQNKKAADFPGDYWLWNATAKRYYHRDEDTDSVVWYGPLD